MIRNIFNKDYAGRNLPIVINDHGAMFGVHRDGNLFEILRQDINIITDAYEYPFDTDEIFLWNRAPKFESKIKAVKYLLENANRLI